MRTLKALSAVLALGVMPPLAFAQQAVAPSKVEIVDKIVAQERAEMQLVRQYSPLVETYIQNLRPDEKRGVALDTDKYFLGRAHFAKGGARTADSQRGQQAQYIRGLAELLLHGVCAERFPANDLSG